MNEKQRTEFILAVRAGKTGIVKQFLANLDAKKDKELLDGSLRAALFVSCNEVIVDLLLKAGADPNQDKAGDTLLMGAATNGNLSLVKRLVAAGAKLHRQVRQETALSAAWSWNKQPVVRYLEKLGVKAPPTTLLLYTCMHGNVARAKQALAAGADTEKAGGLFKQTPLMAAAHNGHTAIVKLLLQHGANPSKRVRDKTALYDAAEHGTVEMVDALVAAGANVQAGRYGETVLMAAAEAGNLRIVKRLVELGANANAQDKNHGMSVLDYAKRSKNKELIAYLQTLGATADRDVPRALARALARKYGGRPVEHVAGFMLNAKFHGLACQFNIGAEGFSLFLKGVNFGVAEFKRSKDVQLIVSAAKPDFQRQKVQEVAKALASEKLRVYRTMGDDPLPAEFVKSFCVRHRKLFGQLTLAKSEVVRLGANFAGFFCPLLDVKVAEERLDTIAVLIQGISQPPQPELNLFEKEWLIKLGAKTGATARHQFGGALEQPVACPGCNCETNLMVRVDLADSALSKTSFSGVSFPVFWCLGCLEWEATFFDLSGEVPRPFSLIAKKPKSAKPGAGEPDLPARPIIFVPVATGKKAGRKSKLGGKPTWLQMEETPDCPKCETAMSFVLQLDSDSNIAYGDMGMLYAFACPKCRVGASLIQSH